MSWAQLNIKKDFIQNGGVALNFDANNDGNTEYSLNKTEDGSLFEIFDFNSDGQKDMNLYYDKDGKFIAGDFWDENGEIWQPEYEDIITFLEQALQLREDSQGPMFSIPDFTQCFGMRDIETRMLELSERKNELVQKMEELKINIQPFETPKEDNQIEKPNIKFG